MLKIAYVGDYLNHGSLLSTTGTPLTILLSLLEEVESIDVFCPMENRRVEPDYLNEKIKVRSFYIYGNPISLLRLLTVVKGKYDKVIFNLLPTGFGNSSFSNLTALLIPIFLKTIFRQKGLIVIYHNSVITNDFKRLGYKGVFNQVRALVLKMIETLIFKTVRTFVFLKQYQKNITNAIGKNKVEVLNGRYLEAITTVFLNEVISSIEMKSPGNTPVILLHGAWGPQKNLSFALDILDELRQCGNKFSVIISGEANNHFPFYKEKLNAMLKLHSGIVHEYLGYVYEKDILTIFSRADLLILPYSSPGGHSGVMEQAIFFEVPTVGVKFSEYVEQSEGIDFIQLCIESDLKETIKMALNRARKIKRIEIKRKLEECLQNVRTILD